MHKRRSEHCLWLEVARLFFLIPTRFPLASVTGRARATEKTNHSSMGSIPQEVVIAGILAAFASHPYLIPPQLFPHADSDPNTIYLLPIVDPCGQAVVAPICALNVKTKKISSLPMRERSMR